MALTFSPEQDQYLQLAQSGAYYQGLRDGVQRYAVWRDGIQYVGLTDTTLSQALLEIDQEQQNLLNKFKELK